MDKNKEGAYDFDESLVEGQRREAEFFNKHAKSIKSRTDGRQGDAIVNDGLDSKLELKSESYTITDTPKTRTCKGGTPNFFIERYSRGKIDGGPWQALSHGCKYYVHDFADDVCFVFDDISALIARLEEIIPLFNLKPEEINNPKYYTYGYKINRELLRDLFREVHGNEDLLLGGKTYPISGRIKEQEVYNEVMQKYTSNRLCGKT